MEIERAGKKTGIYRSKLEQAWAMFFVECGIPFIHEPKYYGNWLPDFELTDSKTLIEIKPEANVAIRELPEKEEGMKLACCEGHDIVVLIGRPRLVKIEAGMLVYDKVSTISPGHLPFSHEHIILLNILGFAERSGPGFYEDIQSIEDIGRDFWDKSAVDFVQCEKCHGYYFVNMVGNYRCRVCGYHRGPLTFSMPEYDKRIIDRYRD